jgi:NosR/NirI family nitrous oxide reductase transcriptional regulator
VVEPSGIEVATGDSGPAWLAVWRVQSVNLAVLAALLTVLVAILVLMQPLSRRPRLLTVLRLGFLAFVLVWLGWVAGAQVTVINLLTWLHAAAGAASVQVVLSDPLIAVLMAFVLVTFVIWGRGVFCGWLCPFGAMQELLGRIARLLRIPEVRLSHATHRLLWPVKYVILAGLVAVSFQSMSAAGVGAEVEPFKTAISLRFARDWPYVAYATVLLAVGLSVERFFCRFMCPLGAAFALGGKLRLRRLNPLKRRPECGSPCQLCTRRCPIQAIEPSGRINMDECFYCLDCQVLHHDERLCPPLAIERKRRVRAADEPAGAPAPAVA